MNLRSLIFSFLLTVFVLSFFPLTAQAQFLPDFLDNLIDTDNPEQVIANRVQVFFLLAFGIVILVAVFYIIMAAIKYIRSQGESGEMEASQKSMQAIFMGIGAIFVGILGIAVIVLFFGSTLSIFQPHPICISQPDSVGCYACKNADNSVDTYEKICDRCNSDTDAVLNTAVEAIEGQFEIIDENGDVDLTDNSVPSNKTCDTTVNVIIGNV